ncbi:hypothetical protein KM176_20820 [Pseudooceanicola sp. CBS1P-1]|uniref:Uncharacterized protein n=1 Tax=Pseudooceanicola albus TaxID=2692189 RepID=A0A6L7G817_9RHOB|nr:MULTISPECIES: hypothetical protein [Pseudooceanicola]MBT9386325.1 hypothetical protein [Pseudooceanicola endophyticus]MXN20374.1 hypothetical protein [Pseudooceanicola albus]
MKPALDDILKGVPSQDGNGGKPLKPSKSSETRRSPGETQLDKITASAKRVLAEEAQARAEKTARLRAARKATERDGNS